MRKGKTPLQVDEGQAVGGRGSAVISESGPEDCDSLRLCVTTPSTSV